MFRHWFALSSIVIFSASLAAQVKPQRVRVSEEAMERLAVSKVAPIYPPLARQARIQGTVIATVVISRTGEVESVQLFSGHPMLAPAALEAIKQWKFEPYELNGEPVEVETQAKVNFTLAGNPPAEGTVASVPGGIPPEQEGRIVGVVRDPQSAPPKRVRVSRNVEAAMIVKKVPPEYPQEAKDQRIQGAVVLRVTIDQLGDVAAAELISGHPALAPAAIDAVKQWKYKPYLLNQQPVQVETQVVVDFTLAN